MIYFLLKYFDSYIFLEKASIDVLMEDEEFRPIITVHLRQEKPPFSGDRTDNSLKTKEICLPPEFVDAVKNPDQIWQADTEIVNSKSAIMEFSNEMASEPGLTDMIICMGGDGTLLHVASIFQNTVPPVISFYMGSLGFLTPFNFADFPFLIKKFYSDGGPCILRNRLHCRVIRGEGSLLCSETCSSLCSLESQLESDSSQILNEATFTRGICPYLATLILCVDGKEVTRFQGDGLIISTPTGSTAYSMSSGASIIHPSVPAILVTPINAHSLSCRPLVLPFCSQLEVLIAPDGRAQCIHLSNDGRLRQHHIIHKTDRVIFTASSYPVPCFGSESPVADWFSDLANCLNWNARHRQNDLKEHLHESQVDNNDNNNSSVSRR
nr:NAD kinase [Hymenolepis microstoma]